MKKFFLIVSLILWSITCFAQNTDMPGVLIFKFDNLTSHEKAQDRIQLRNCEYFSMKGYNVLKGKYMKSFVEQQKRLYDNQKMTPEIEEEIIQKFFRVFNVKYIVHGTIHEFGTSKKHKGSFFLNPAKLTQSLYTIVELEAKIIDPETGITLFQNRVETEKKDGFPASLTNKDKRLANTAIQAVEKCFNPFINGKIIPLFENKEDRTFVKWGRGNMEMDFSTKE